MGCHEIFVNGMPYLVPGNTDFLMSTPKSPICEIFCALRAEYREDEDRNLTLFSIRCLVFENLSKNEEERYLFSRRTDKPELGPGIDRDRFVAGLNETFGGLMPWRSPITLLAALIRASCDSTERWERAIGESLLQAERLTGSTTFDRGTGLGGGVGSEHLAPKLTSATGKQPAFLAPWRVDVTKIIQAMQRGRTNLTYFANHVTIEEAMLTELLEMTNCQIASAGNGSRVASASPSGPTSFMMADDRRLASQEIGFLKRIVTYRKENIGGMKDRYEAQSDFVSQSLARS